MRLFLCPGLGKQDLVPAPQLHHIGVLAQNAHKGALPLAIERNLDVKGVAGPGAGHGDLGTVEEAIKRGKVSVGCARQDFQLPIRVAEDHPGAHSRGKSLAPAGMRDDDAFDVFDDVAAHGKQDPVGACAEDPPGKRPGVGHGDGLGAAHRGHQLPRQNVTIQPLPFGVHRVHLL